MISSVRGGSFFCNVISSFNDFSDGNFEAGCKKGGGWCERCEVMAERLKCQSEPLALPV